MGYIPYDCSRCTGVKNSDGELVAPCNTCARVLWAEPSGPRSPWYVTPPREPHGECRSHWPTGEQM